jgi:hypothetical protein
MSEELNNQQPPQENEEVNSSAAAENQETPPESNQQNKQSEQITEQKPQEKAQEEPQDYSNVTEVEDASNILKGKGINYDELQTEFNERGELSEETFKKLEEAGISRDIANAYIEGRKAVVEKTWDDIASVVGGREQMNMIVEWARNNLSQEEKESIDAVRDPNLIKIILQNLNNRMTDKEGILPQPIQGGGGDDSGNYFRSMAEVEEAINDPKYAKDEVYRNEVARKISASREAGVLELK